MASAINGYVNIHTKRMLALPITDLSRLMGRKWFMPLSTLAERSGIPLYTLSRAIAGGDITAHNHEQKLRTFLEAL